MSKGVARSRCIACGGSRITSGRSRKTVHYLDGRGQRKPLRVSVDHDRCEGCGAAWHRPDHLRPVHDAIVSAMGCMPPSELLRRRRSQCMTQVEFARRAGVSLRRVGQLERGTAFPTPREDGLLRIALGMGRRRASSARG